MISKSDKKCHRSTQILLFEWEMLQKTRKSNLNAKWFWRFTKTDIKAPPIGCWHKMFPLWWHKLSSLCKFYSISYCYEGIKGLCQFMTEQQNLALTTSHPIMFGNTLKNTIFAACLFPEEIYCVCFVKVCFIKTR